ncbi:MAG: hypothetical protein JEY71_02360 [Sphaerochaeta sp.]|nr:hypothetical protein [Sphaerochaeta sp.]
MSKKKGERGNRNRLTRKVMSEDPPRSNSFLVEEKPYIESTYPYTMRTMALYETSQGENSEQTLVLKVENTKRTVYPRRKGVVLNMSFLLIFRSRKPMTVSRRESIRSTLRARDKCREAASCASTSESRQGMKKRAEVTGKLIRTPS